MPSRIISLAVATGLLFLQSAAHAHGFHYQVNVSSQFQTDAAGKLTAIAMDWDYDPQVTSVMLEDEDLSPAKRDQTLQSLTKRLMDDLAVLHYFTELQRNDETVLFNEPTAVSLKVQGIDHAQHLLLHFQLPLQAPISAQEQPLTLTLADPYATGSLSYADTSKVVLPSTWQGCSLKLNATAANEKPVQNEVKLDCTSSQQTPN